MAALVVIVDSKDGAPRRIEFERSPVRIGRGEDNDVQIPLAFVSERHAQIRFDGDRAEYVDLGSTNGSFLGEARLAPHVPIQVQGAVEVRIGTVRLTLERRPEQEQAPEPEPYVPPPPPRPSPELAAAATVAADSASPDLPTPAPPAGKAPARHSVFNPPTIIPPSIEDRPPASGKSRSPKFVGLPTIYPSAAEPVPAPRPVIPEPPPVRSEQLAGEIQVPAQPPTKSQPLPSPTGRAQPTPGPAAARPDSAELADLRNVASALCDELMKLRAATEAFGRETGIRTFSLSERSRLHELHDGAELLRYLTSGATRSTRLQELRALFSDLVTHQLAMMGAIVEGARATLGRVDPQEFTAGKSRRRLPFLDGNRFEEYVEHFRGVQADDQAIQEAVFGSEFAEAYAAARGK
jgi:type VI secretion system protein ImpI